MDEPAPTLTPVKIFVMSPSDVNDERETATKIIHELDGFTRSTWSMTLSTLRWEPLTGDVGRTAQQITNDAYLRMPERIYVGIMWQKVGSPSGGVDPDGRPYESGTIEEFERVLAFKRASGTDWPRILFYRRRGGILPDDLLEQYAKVVAFFKEFAPQGRHPGRVFDYTEHEQFADRLRKDLLNILGELHREITSGRAQPAPATPTSAIPAAWERQYLAALRDELERIPIPVPVEGRAASCRLDAVYVPLDVTLMSKPAANTEHVRLLALERVLVTGDPGSGKSTLLRHTALKVVGARLGVLKGGSAQQADGRLPPMLPIWIDLVDAAARFARDDGTLPEFVRWETWLPALAAATSLTEPQVDALLRRGDVIVFLDRLDEVVDPVHRRSLAQGIGRLQAESRPLGAHNHVVVACRTRAVEPEWAAGFDELRIRAMSRTTRDGYLDAWCRELWGAQARASVDKILDAVRSSPALAELAATPQIATMLAGVAERDTQLPLQRVPLYDQFVSAVASAGRMRVHGGAEAVRGHLVALAHAMQLAPKAGALDLTEARALLRSRGGAPSLLDDLVLHTGLVAVDRRLGGGDLGATVRFVHRTLQEFLAACTFAADPTELLANALDPDWVETLAMTAGVLALERSARLQQFLADVVGRPRPAADSEDEARALVEWAPRVAAASVCLAEISTLDADEAVLEPVRAAQSAILPALRGLDVRRRVEIADGLGSVRDPRLSAAARWVEVPAGAFLRGSDDPDGWEQERPLSPVTVSCFRIQRWPVTVEEYRQFVREGFGYARQRWWSAEGWKWRTWQDVDSPDGWEHQELRPNRPVTGVSWWEATAYCAWLMTEGSVPDGWVATLPTEAQWEKSARGPAHGELPARRFPWGDDWDERDLPANFEGVTREACPVGLFAADESPYGVWDLAGNVAERCRDGFAPYEPAPGPDPVCTDYTHGHVVRGGSFAAPPLDLRVTARFGEAHAARDGSTGFRIALEPAGP